MSEAGYRRSDGENEHSAPPPRAHSPSSVLSLLSPSHQNQLILKVGRPNPCFTWCIRRIFLLNYRWVWIAVKKKVALSSLTTCDKHSAHAADITLNKRNKKKSIQLWSIFVGVGVCVLTNLSRCPNSQDSHTTRPLKSDSRPNDSFEPIHYNEWLKQLVCPSVSESVYNKSLLLRRTYTSEMRK